MLVPTIQSSNVSFGYSHPLKTAFKKGLMPTVHHDIWGNPLTKKNVSLDHIICKCDGGKSELGNFLLADAKANNKRGCTPIENMVTYEQLRLYLRQFKDIKNRYIDGNEYIRAVRRTFKQIVEGNSNV